jgi:hypothetical protein
MGYTITSSSLAPWKQQQIDMKNQLMGGLLSSLGYSSPSSNNNGYMSGGYNTQSPETSGSMANAGNTSTSWGSNLYNTGAQRLTDTYNKAVQANINDANRRGLFGSSIAAQASQDTAKAYGQGLAELAANIGAQEAQYGLTQQQINNQRLNTLLGLFD